MSYTPHRNAAKALKSYLHAIEKFKSNPLKQPTMLPRIFLISFRSIASDVSRYCLLKQTPSMTLAIITLNYARARCHGNDKE